MRRGKFSIPRKGGSKPMTEPEKPTLAGALLKLQDQAPTLTKDATGQIQSRNYKYTPLDTIVEKIGPLLVDNGLVWTTRPSGSAEAPTLVYELIHAESGEAIAGEMPLMIGENPTSQALGSAITYARRYALTAVLNLVADEDDDGAAAQSYGRAAQKPAQGSGPRSGRPMASEAQIKLIGKLLKQNKITEEQRAIIFARLGIPHDLHANELTGGKDGQASSLITFLTENPTPTGKSDVPDDASGFEQPTLEGGDPVPFDEEPK
jgi:hypothetical protein